MHSVLKITLPVIALWHKFSDNHACIVLRPGYVTYQNGTVFLRKKRGGIVSHDQGNAGMAVWHTVLYGPTFSHARGLLNYYVS